MAKAVFCIANTRDQAETIVDRLRVAGFTGDDISVLLPDKSGTKDFAHEKATKAPEGGLTGAGAGGVAGGALGYLAGIGAIAIPGIGPLVAAGPIMAALSGAAVGGAVGGVTGALVGMGMPEIEAKRYEGKVKEGNILISAHAENQEQSRVAKSIFEEVGAEDISTGGVEDVDEDTEGRRAGEGRSREMRTGERSVGHGRGMSEAERRGERDIEGPGPGPDPERRR